MFIFENRMSFNGKLGSEVSIVDFESLAHTHDIKNYLDIIQKTQFIKNEHIKNLLHQYHIQKRAIDEICSSCRNII